MTHDQTGRLFEPEDSNGLVNELIYLLQHPQERLRLGGNLRKHVESNFTWEHSYQKYIEIVSRVL